MVSWREVAAQEGLIKPAQAAPAQAAASSWRDIVAAEGLKAAPTPEAEEPGWFDRGTKSYAVAKGIINGLTFGTADRGSAAIGAMLPGDSYDEALKRGQEGTRSAKEDHVGYYAGGELAGAVLPALVTGGASTIPRAAAYGATQGIGHDIGGEGETTVGSMIGSGLTGAALGSVLRGGHKIPETTVGRWIFNKIASLGKSGIKGGAGIGGAYAVDQAVGGKFSDAAGKVLSGK